MLNMALLEEYNSELIRLRRHFHQFPELSNQEYETSKYIAEYLRECGLEVHTGLANTGVVGILTGSAGPKIGIRADMDALPIQEANEVSYRSNRPNIMHACGHDGHIAVVLCTAKILASVKEQIKGTVVFIFQPAEEDLPEGGAKRLIAEGEELFSDMQAVFGFHFWPEYESGMIGVSKDIMMAAGDTFEVTFSGPGAHGAMPHKSPDVLMMACDSVLSITSIVIRSLEPGTPATLSVGIVQGGLSPNVLPSEACIKGTTRYAREDLREFIPKKIDNILEGLSKKYGASYELKYEYGYPVLRNSPNLAEIVKKCAIHINGDVVDVTTPSLGSEDFSRFLEKIPGCYFWVGTKNQSKDVENFLHNPKYDLDDTALMAAVKMLIMISQEFV